MPTLRKYTPVLYILMTGKTTECYWQAFNYLASEVPAFDPFSVGVDFEKAFFSTVADNYPEAYLIGCLFHFKQALLKNLKDRKIKPDHWAFAMKKGVLDALVVIPRDQLEDGVLYIRTKIMDFVMDSEYEQEDIEKWDNFFDKYFNK